MRFIYVHKNIIANDRKLEMKIRSKWYGKEVNGNMEIEDLGKEQNEKKIAEKNFESKIFARSFIALRNHCHFG